MFGWINESIERLIVCRFGIDTWREIKRRAGCVVPDGGFIRHRHYSDESSVGIILAASEVLRIPVDRVLESYGAFFMEFTRQEGYANLLDCQGSTLRLWLSNLNALHDHLASSLPAGFVPPVFWCEDDEAVAGSILLHYHSKRGSFLAPLVVGIVREVARHHFDLRITMDRLATQDDDGSKFTTWRISAVDESQKLKLTDGESTSTAPPSNNTHSITDLLKHHGFHYSHDLRERLVSDSKSIQLDGHDSTRTFDFSLEGSITNEKEEEEMANDFPSPAVDVDIIHDLNSHNDTTEPISSPAHEHRYVGGDSFDTQDSQTQFAASPVSFAEVETAGTATSAEARQCWGDEAEVKAEAQPVSEVVRYNSHKHRGHNASVGPHNRPQCPFAGLFPAAPSMLEEAATAASRDREEEEHCFHSVNVGPSERLAPQCSYSETAEAVGEERKGECTNKKRDSGGSAVESPFSSEVLSKSAYDVGKRNHEGDEKKEEKKESFSQRKHENSSSARRISSSPSRNSEKVVTGSTELEQAQELEVHRTEGGTVDSAMKEQLLDVLESAVGSPSTPAAVNTAPVHPTTSQPSISLSAENMQKVFPYHVVVDEYFVILQVGKDLPNLLGRHDLIGSHLENVLEIVRPPHCGWDWLTLHKLEDQTFFMEPVGATEKRVKIKGNMVTLSTDPKHVMFVLSPDAKNVRELRDMNLTMSDLPLHSFQRDAVFLGEHIASEVRSAHMLNKLSKKLDREMKLSNMLLYQMLPRRVAHDLRAGKQVDPEHFDNVTIFFSDIVGFTKICSGLEPPIVIDLLNKLYIVMDYVAERFGLYKVETIGDAYMVCSGLPTPDKDHAHKVAMFALVVREAVKFVTSPHNDEPIKLRIGIHTGSCMAGVVGNLMPRYCLFGDTVNTASRHESTGHAGKIHCSSTTYDKLIDCTDGSDDVSKRYRLTRRGFVDMKGKGKMVTYWLDFGDRDLVNANGMSVEEICNAAGILMMNTTTGPRKYFRRESMTSTASSFA